MFLRRPCTANPVVLRLRVSVLVAGRDEVSKGDAHAVQDGVPAADPQPERIAGRLAIPNIIGDALGRPNSERKQQPVRLAGGDGLEQRHAFGHAIPVVLAGAYGLCDGESDALPDPLGVTGCNLDFLGNEVRDAESEFLPLARALDYAERNRDGYGERRCDAERHGDAESDADGLIVTHPQRVPHRQRNTHPVSEQHAVPERVRERHALPERLGERHAVSERVRERQRVAAPQPERHAILESLRLPVAVAQSHALTHSVVDGDALGHD